MLAAFTPGNLVVYRVGTGAAALSSASTDVFLDEYATNGTLVQSVAMPTAAIDSNQPLTAAGTSTSEGQITRSTDGRFIVATGYAAAPGTASIASSAAATYNRVVGRIAADGTIDTSTTMTSFSGGGVRSVASADGSDFWVSGSNTGVVYQPLGGSGNGTIVSSTTSSGNLVNLRNVGIFDNQLYVGSGSGSNRMLSVGTGVPTTSGQTMTQLPGFPTGSPSSSPWGFFFADLDAAVAGVDTLYVADSTAGAIQKYSLVSGSWTGTGTATAASVYGLTGTVSGATVTLYATSASTFSTLTDSSGYNGTLSGAVTSRSTASANTAFRGIAFAPEGGAVVVVPTLADPTTAALTNNSVTLEGNVTDGGGAQVTARGFVYSVTSVNGNPAIGGSGVTQAAAGTGPGAFSVPVTSLIPGTQYTVKSYATNSAGTAYSAAITFTTSATSTAPVVTAPTSTAILDIEALLGGTVTSDGGAAVTERGIVIALTSANPAPEIGGTGVTTVPAATAGTGTFTQLVTALTASSDYTFRAYAINSVGTAYSEVATFTTAVAATSPVIGSPTKTNIGSTTATLGGQVTSNGGRPVTERGVVYAKTSDNPDPEIGGAGVTTVPGTLGIGVSTFTVAVTGLQALTGYTFKAYATNSAGTSYTTLDTFTTYDTPTTLTAGDVAFTGFDPAGSDKLSFVLLTSVVAGTTITLTDNSWSGSALSTNEGSSTVTFLDPFSAGTVFDYDGTRITNQKWQWGANAGTPSAVGVSDVTSNFSFAAGGDNVFAYQGTAPASGSASNWVGGFSSLAWIETGTPTTGTSYLPSGLTEGDTSFSLNYAVGASPQSGELINLGTVQDSAAGIRTTVYTSTNWQTTVSPFPEATIFVIGSPVAPAIGTTGTLSALSTTYGTASSSTTVAVTGTNLTADITATSPAGFEVSSDGTTFGATATFTRTAGAVSGTLSVRIASTTAAGSWSGNVVLASTGATDVNVPIPSSTVAIDTVIFDVPTGDTVTDTIVRIGSTRIIKRGGGTLILDQANSYVSGTVVEAGTLVVSNGDALGTGTTTVNATGTLQVGAGVTVKTQTVTIAGGTLAAAGATILVNATTGIGLLAITSGSVTGIPGLTVSGNGVLTLPTDRRQVVDVSTLSIDQAGGGRIDIGTGRINIAASGITEADLRADLIAGRNSGAFNGTTGIMTTGGKASVTSANPVVGYRVLGTGAAIVAWAAYGDSNLDGQVNTTDINLINTGGKFGQGASTGAVWSQGDYNYSNGVTTTDINLVNGAAMFGAGSYLPITPTGLTNSAISLAAWAAFATDSQTPRQTKKK